MKTRELTNVDYGPFFNEDLFNGFRDYLADNDLTADEIVRDGFREFYFFEEDMGLAVVNLKTRRIHFRLVEQNILSRLSEELPFDVKYEVKLVQKARVVNG